jgi:phage pi2 protein 07
MILFLFQQESVRRVLVQEKHVSRWGSRAYPQQTGDRWTEIAKSFENYLITKYNNNLDEGIQGDPRQDFLAKSAPPTS